MGSDAFARALILTMGLPRAAGTHHELGYVPSWVRKSPDGHYPECEFAGTHSDIDDSGAFRDFRIVS